jgi:CBS domain-containing protein
MLNVEKIMQSDPRTVSPELTLVDLERLFLSSRFTGFPVVENERLVGVISRSDIIRSMVVERSRSEQLSDFYCGAQTLATEDPAHSLEATAAQVGMRLAEPKVEDVMVRNVVSIDSSESLQRLSQIMLEANIHRLPVVNDNKLVGLITTMDLVRAIAEGHLREPDEIDDPQILLSEGSRDGI